MSDSIERVLCWLHDRPFQDNPDISASAAMAEVKTWGEWLNEGKEISDLEKQLVWLLENDEDSVNRSAAAMALGFIGREKSIRKLVMSLKNDIPVVAMEAATSLGRLKSLSTVKHLCEASKHTDVNVRASSCTALGTIGGEQAVTCLEEARWDSDPFVQAAVKEALGRIR